MNIIEELEEGQDMPSLNHSLLQARLVRLIDDHYVPLTELSLDVSSLSEEMLSSLNVSKELQPDVCLYASGDPEIRLIDVTKQDDLLKVKKMPLLVIEILSPTQGSKELFAKVRAYFALGVKSVWIIDPGLRIIVVYGSLSQPHIYQVSDEEVIDEVLDIHLAMSKVFAER